MIERGRTIWGIIGLLVAAGSARAGMMPMGAPGAATRLRAVVDVTNAPHAFFSPLPRTGGVDPRGRHGGATYFSTEGSGGAAPSQAAPPLRVLTGGPGSLELGLYALMGLGLCRSAPWVRKLSFAIAPDWCLIGGPYQIGHSLVMGPDCRGLVSLPLGIQPGSAQVDCLSGYRLTAVTSAARRYSQFTPGPLSCRGPPPSTHPHCLA